ncbi:phosphotransferase enzyme family protein [Streptomyces sp. enrichment culture]|uniref:phosphotransferase enzyme family protein n=1 Tax=Streptomyces sp. enrichment culture TaxID=1795815 RepID=UPI003F553B96
MSGLPTFGVDADGGADRPQDALGAFPGLLRALGQQGVQLAVRLHEGVVPLAQGCDLLVEDLEELVLQLTPADTSSQHGCDAALAPLLDQAEVLHLSDAGAGADRCHSVAAQAGARITVGQRIEVAVEWTGTDRSPAACLHRYRAARAWWDRVLHQVAAEAVTTFTLARVAGRSPNVMTEKEQRAMPTTTTNATEPPTATQITEILADAYGLAGARLTRLDGQVAINYRAESEDGRVVFVKHYQPAADLTAEEDVIAQTRLAGQHGVPVAAVIPSCDGEAITRHAATALSVWQWMPGHTVESGLTPAQQAAAGHMLGRIHAAFADHPASVRPSPKADRWLAPDLAKREATINRLSDLINGRAEHDEFDRQAAATLAERRTQLRHLPGLLAGLPPLHTQVLHGDYSVKNILFSGDDITAVVDFGPTEPYLAAWELGRIAFDPRSIVHAPDWIASGLTLVTAYREANPHLPAADVTACARVALIQLAVSLYGVKEHYLAPGLDQGDLDQFWLLRHHAASALLDRLDEVEAALAHAAHTSNPPSR